MSRVLILRPEPGGAASAARAVAAGLAATVAPLFVVEPIGWRAPAADAFDALVLTSANAVRHGGAGLDGYRALPVYAVGGATAAAAAGAGFDVVATGAADGAAMIAQAAAGVRGRVLHLAGRAHRPLASAGVTVTTVTVYDAVAVAALPAAAIGALGDGAVALLYSPRAGTVFRALCAAAGIAPAAVRIAAISARAAASAGGGWAAVAIAARPDDESLLAVAAGLCDQGAGRNM